MAPPAGDPPPVDLENPAPPDSLAPPESDEAGGGVARRSNSAAPLEIPPPNNGPSLLRCGNCAEIFGLPPNTPADAAARCPLCQTVNRQPPSFADKHQRLQKRLQHMRLVLQHQRRTRTAQKLRLRISRNNVLGDSFSQLRSVQGSMLASLPLAITFDGEEGIDQGGVTRDWMYQPRSTCHTQNRQQLTPPPTPRFEWTAIPYTILQLTIDIVCRWAVGVSLFSAQVSHDAGGTRP
jgi:hypothetical protein